MSRKKRTVKKKIQKRPKHKHVISNQQKIRLQQAVQAQLAGDLPFAESEYRVLIAEKTSVPQLFCNLALICAQTSRPKEAHSLWVKALAIDPKYLDAAMSLANSYQQAGKIDRALGCYRRIISDHPHVVAAKYLLANLLKSQGKFAEAAAYYQQIMVQQPDYTQAHFTYSGIHRYQDKSDPHIGLMLGLYQKNNLPTDRKIHLAFALAKAFEDIGDYPQAFRYLETGNSLRYEMSDYRIDRDKRLVRSIVQNFSREALSQLNVDAESSDRPIFIVGMPRSGTSLVEKILSTHSAVYGAGELDYFHTLATGLFLKESNDFLFDSLERYPKSAFATLGKAYLGKIELLDKQTSRITDKMPFNLFMIGLIGIALPKARIIHCVREAKDNCLSIYKTNFATENYRFAYNLKTLGQFHNQYRMLMRHWHQVMPGAIYDIAYESLTSDPEREIRKLLSACDLEWQERCMSFEKSAGIVKTASAYQVRQPMYTGSVRLWEKYQEFLQPLFDELHENIDELHENH